MSSQPTKPQSKRSENIRVHGFEPIYRHDARVLILGTLPGQVSLEIGQYYAQPLNAFWRIMSILNKFELNLSYEQRLECLKNAGIALWDVIETADRKGSLDRKINKKTILVNSFDEMLNECDDLTLICANGKDAFDLFQKYVSPVLSEKHRSLPMLRLPSTSSALPMSSFVRIEQWRLCIEPHLLTRSNQNV